MCINHGLLSDEPLQRDLLNLYCTEGRSHKKTPFFVGFYLVAPASSDNPH